jgi:Tfp pilus assembly protein PilV
MKINPVISRKKRGSSLVEAIIAVGVLAVAVPLVFATMAESGESGLAAQAETRSSWMVPACMEELQLAMKGRSAFLEEMTPSLEFPVTGGLVALAFTSEGAIAGKVSQNAYERGLRDVDGIPAKYIVSMTGELPDADADDSPQCLSVTLTIEYPAAAPAAKRQKLEFHTRMP